MDEREKLLRCREYYYVDTINDDDCSLAISKAVAIAKAYDKKITLAMSKLNYDIISSSTSVIHKIVSIATTDDNYDGCKFNLLIPDISRNEFSDITIVYDSPIGDVMRQAYYSNAKNIILIPVNKLDWELFFQAFHPILISSGKEENKM